MRALSTALVGALLVAAASPATAAVAAKAGPAKSGAPRAGGPSADVRCLMTMYAFGQDKTRAQAGQMGVYFFAGRINSEAPGFDLAAAMRAEAPKLTPPALQEELKRCGAMVAAASQSLQTSINGLRPPGSAPGAAPGAAAAPVAPSPAPMATPMTPAPK